MPGAIKRASNQVEETAHKAELVLDKILFENAGNDEQFGRRLARISKGFIAEIKEDAEQNGDTQEIIPAVVSLVRAIVSQLAER